MGWVRSKKVASKAYCGARKARKAPARCPGGGSARYLQSLVDIRGTANDPRVLQLPSKQVKVYENG